MCTTMKPLEEDTSPELFWWTWNPEPWIQSELDLLVNYSDQITSSSDKPEPETTGPKDTILKELSWSTQSSMSSEKKPKDAIAYKDSKSVTHSEVVPVQVWELCWSQRSEKNTQIELWKPSPSCLHPRSQTQSLNPTTPLYQCINWSKTPMSAWSLITRPCTISASEP